jgi:hypothetical protein
VLIRKSGGSWTPPDVLSYGNERELQELIASSPELVGSTADAVTIPEFPLRDAGRLDLLVVDVDGSLTLVEAKLNRNPEIRRAVVGQLLGYAGGLWGMSYDELDAAVDHRLGAPLIELAQASREEVDLDADDFRAQVARNLSEGAFRLVFAVDEITEDLKRAVEYLNAKTVLSLEVLVFELGYSKVDDLEILLPSTFGEEAAHRKRVSRAAAERWNEAEFFATLAERASDEELALVRQLFKWAKPRVRSFSSGGGARPACNFVFEAPEGPVRPCRIVLTSGALLVRVNFDLARRRPRAALEAMLDRLCAVPGIAAVREEILEAGFARQPALPVGAWGADGIDALIESLELLLQHPTEDPPTK